MRLTQIETSSTSSKRAGDFHSITWRTVWHLEGAVDAVRRPRQRRAHELEAGEIGVLAVARVEHHVLGVAVLVAHAQIVAERLASCACSSVPSRPDRAIDRQAVGADRALARRAASGAASSNTSRPRSPNGLRPARAERLGAARDHHLVDQVGVQQRARRWSARPPPARASRRPRRATASTAARSRRPSGVGPARAVDLDAGGIARRRCAVGAEDDDRHAVRGLEHLGASAGCGTWGRARRAAASGRRGPAAGR